MPRTYSLYGWLLVCCLSACQQSDLPSSFLVSVLPNDTLFAVDSGVLERPVDLTLLPDGVLEIEDAGILATVRVDPTTRDVVAVDSLAVSFAGSMTPLARLPDGGRWVVTDSVPRIQRLGPDGVPVVDRPILATELTSIRVNGLYRAEAEGTVAGTRYATDVRVVADGPWVLLNMTVQEGAVILVFDEQGVQRGKIVLPATEGGRRFVVDTATATVFVTSPAPPQLLSVSLRGHEFLWRGSP